MVPEPANSAAQSTISGISAGVLAWTGITFHSILWSFFGVLAALVFLSPQVEDGKRIGVKAVVTVFIATMIGAGLAEVAHAMALASGIINATGGETVKLGLALILGASAKPVLVAGINRAVKIIGGE